VGLPQGHIRDGLHLIELTTGERHHDLSFPAVDLLLHLTIVSY
jgi:hypothetical protein